MKNTISIFAVAILSTLLLASCGGPKDDKVTVENGAFTCKPETIIDTINLHVENDPDGQYYTCEPFQESGESIRTSDDFGRIILTFDTTDDGYITHCKLYWVSSDLNMNTVLSAGLYCGVILNTLSADNADKIANDINEIVVAGSGSTSYDSNGVIVKFQSLDGKNWLDVSVKE